MKLELLDKITENTEEDPLTIEEINVNDLIRPNRIENHKDHVKINDTFYRCIMVEGFPRSVSSHFIADMLNNKADMDISLRIKPYTQNNARRKVRNQLTKLEKDKRRKTRKGQIAESIKNRIKDIKNLHEALDTGEERLFDVSLNIATGAKDKDTLEKNTKKAVSEMNKQQLISGKPFHKMLQAFKTTLPTTKNSIRKHVKTQPRSMPTGATAELFPFAGNPSSFDQEGILIGTNLQTRQPLLTDVYSSTNPNWLSVGTSGSGKSFAAKLMVSRYAAQGVKTFIIDPHGEYSSTVKNLSGQNIKLSIKKGNMINPLDLMGHSFREKMIALKEFYSIMFDGLSKAQKPKIMKATRKTYRKKGILKEDPETWDRKPPKLRDLLQTLEQMKSKEKSKTQKKSFEVLIDQLEPYVYGVNNFLDTNTSVNVDSQITNFNIEELPESYYPELMFIILDFLHSQMKQDQKRKMIVIDEAWELLSSAVGKKNNLDQSFVFRTVKTSRKYNLSLGLIVQELNDLLESRQGNSVLANTSTKLILKQDRSVSQKIGKQLQLNQKEKQLIKSAKTGQGLFISDDKHTPIMVKASEKEKNLHNTDPGHVVEEPETKQKYELKRSDDEKLFPEKDLYLKDQLTDVQLETLKSHDDWSKSHTPLFHGSRGKTRMVRTSGKGGADHQALMYGYRNWLQDKVEDVECSESFADIEFETVEGRFIGVEIETGSNLRHDKASLENKAERNDERYDYWFIVVTQKKLKPEYSHYADTFIRNEVKEKLEEYG